MAFSLLFAVVAEGTITPFVCKICLFWLWKKSKNIEIHIFFKKKKMDWIPWNVYLFQLFIKQCNFCYLGYLYIQIIENKSVHGCKLMAPCVALCTRTNFSNVSWPRIIILGFKTSHPKTNLSKLPDTLEKGARQVIQKPTHPNCLRQVIQFFLNKILRRVIQFFVVWDKSSKKKTVIFYHF